MKLIDNAKQAWKLFSVQVAGVAVAWGLLPEARQAAILEFVGVASADVPAVIGVVFILARLVKQGK